MITERCFPFGFWRAAVILAAGLAASCQGVQNPGQAGFGDGIRNLLDGTYDNRVTALEQEHQTLEADNAAWRTRVSELEDVRMGQEIEIAALDRRLSELEGGHESLRQRLQQARRSRRADQAALSQAEAELAQLELQREALAADQGRPAEDRTQEIEDLEARSRRLQQNLEEALLLGSGN